MASETKFSLQPQPLQPQPTTLPTYGSGNINITSFKATTSYYSFIFPAFTTLTNLGPLTSRISFPTDCYDKLIDMNRDGLGPSGAWKTIGCAISTCCPSGKFYTEEWAWMTSYYSPGVCPSDYQSCPPPTQRGLVLAPREGEKIVFCCPNSMRMFLLWCIDYLTRWRLPMSQQWRYATHHSWWLWK